MDRLVKHARGKVELGRALAFAWDDPRNRHDFVVWMALPSGCGGHNHVRFTPNSYYRVWRLTYV